MRWMSWIGGLALLVSGCVADLDLSDKPCPCAQGYVCVDDRCVPGAPGVDGGVTAGRIGVVDFHSDWQTPNSLHWRWTLEGDPSDFGELLLVIAESEEDVVARSGTARIVDRTERASLGVYYRQRTDGERDVVSSVFTDEHTPATRYYAQIVAIDNRGRESRSNVAPADTQGRPLEGVLLFSDERPPGYPLPDGSVAPPLRHVSEAPYGDTTHHLSYEQTYCPNETAICFENLRWQKLAAGPLSMNGGSFALAYLEMALAIESTEPAFWSELGIGLDVPDGDTGHEIWVFKPFVPRYDEGYHIVQIPLRVLEGSGDTLTHARATATTVESFRFGSMFPVGSRVRIDEVWIRW